MQFLASPLTHHENGSSGYRRLALRLILVAILTIQLQRSNPGETLSTSARQKEADTSRGDTTLRSRGELGQVLKYSVCYGRRVWRISK
jgi:hypothetical protein